MCWSRGVEIFQLLGRPQLTGANGCRCNCNLQISHWLIYRGLYGAGQEYFFFFKNAVTFLSFLSVVGLKQCSMP